MSNNRISDAWLRAQLREQVRRTGIAQVLTLCIVHTIIPGRRRVEIVGCNRSSGAVIRCTVSRRYENIALTTWQYEYIKRRWALW